VTNKKRLGLAIPMTLYEELKSEAQSTGHTLNALILEILWDWEKQ